MKKDLTQITGTYTNLLYPKLQEIYQAFDASDVSTEDFKVMILDIIKDAKETNAKINFVNNIARSKSKTNLVFYVSNAVMCASGFGIN